jgi:1,4-dihydroxy-2-naphthoate polyprenyltransferase
MTTAVGTIREAGVLEKVKPWIALQQFPKHLAGLFPFILGTILVYWTAGTIDFAIFGAALLALYLLTNGTYISNEYFDLETDIANTTRIGGADRVSVTTTGGTRVLVKGQIPPRQALIASIVFFALAVPVGLYMQFVLGTGALTIPLGLLGLFIGWYYTAPPIRACYRGWGEAFIAAGQGVIVFGAFYVQLGFSWVPILVSLPWVLALPALKIMREFPDLEADLSSGKRGLTLILGRMNAARLYALLVVAAIAAFIPIYAILDSRLFALVGIPIFMLARSVWLMATGGWLDPQRAEKAAISGFIGMLTIPVVLSIAFGLAALR